MKMCIRYSFNGSDPAGQRLLVHLATDVQVMEHLGRIQFQVIVVGGINPGSIHPFPVSYTHLDVYKRQLSYSFSRIACSTTIKAQVFTRPIL